MRKAFLLVLLFSAASLRAEKHYTGWNSSLEARCSALMGPYGFFGLLLQDEDPVAEVRKKRDELKKALACPHVDQGFQDLGEAGSSWGAVTGPTSDYTGFYRVIEHYSDEISMEINTPCEKRRLSLIRLYNPDTKVCEDYIRQQELDFKDGKAEEKGKPVSVKGKITYHKKKDEGLIEYPLTLKEKGTEKTVSRAEDFWEGNNGDRKMKIEMGGGYDFEFEQGPPVEEKLPVNKGRD